MEQALTLLIVQLRSMQLYYHNCHILASGSAFFADHKMFQKFYKELEDDFDSAAERCVGLFDSDLDLGVMIPAMGKNLDIVTGPYMNDPVGMTQDGLLLEQEVLKTCEMIVASPETTAGTEDLVSEIASHSEARVYKIKQHLKSEQYQPNKALAAPEAPADQTPTVIKITTLK